MPSSPLRALALGLILALSASATASAAGVPDRKADPVVLTGARTPALLGTAPGKVVAFRWDGKWKQVPVQVDERAMVDYRAVRQTTGFAPFSHLAYTDPGTFAGADPDPQLDADDEIAAMAKDAGKRADRKDGDPKGVAGSTQTRVKVSDPLQKDSTHYLYLYRSKGDLDPAAGKSYVKYDFELNSGDYKTTYDFSGIADDGNGPPVNLENSSVRTPFYSQHFLSRWVQDALQVTAGDATGVDILDGDKDQVSYGCGRSELTFSRGGGGFIVNKSGPVRAIRSYIGANSGTFTQQDHVYYEQGDVTTTFLRVHPGITTIDQFLDYSPAAAGMTYRNSAKPLGVTIDGNPDTGMETGNALGPQITWEQTTGPQGSVTLVTRVATDLPGFTPGSYYQDDSTSPATQQCGGYADNQAWGASGPAFTSSGSNTDPTLAAPVYSLTGTRSNFYSGPGADASLAELRSKQVDSPLKVSVASKP
jgi:hypothetical protein